MKYKKMVKTKNVTAAVALTFAISAQGIGSVYAETSMPQASETGISANISALKEEQEVGSFTKFHGTVTEIRESGENTIIRLETETENEEEEAIYDFISDENTVILSHDDFILVSDIQIGDTFTAFYIMPQFMTMIYPPQLTANVLVKDATEGIESVMVSYFDSDLLSADKQLKLNVNTENPILDIKGEAYTETLEEKVLVVFLTFMTMSLPAQTSPTKIIVLDIDKEALENALPTITSESKTEPEPGVSSEDIPLKLLQLHELSNVGSMSYFVNGKNIDAPSAYADGNGVIMVPLRALAEAMGYNVTWDEEYRQAHLGVAISVYVDKDYYTIARLTPIELGTAPVIKNDRIFVPITFFKDVVKTEFKFDNDSFYFEYNITL